MRKQLLLTALAGTLLGSVQAQTSTDSLQTKGEFSINGYVDAYYFYNLNDPQSGLNQARIFDLPHNNFNLGMVQTVLNYSYGKSKVVADLAFGPNADLGNFTNFISPNAGVRSSSALAIKQAFLSYNLTNKLTFTIGQYGTHIGYELIDAPLNYNYSLSYLFGNGPFYHTGAKLDYALSDKVSLMAGVVNGWDMLQDLNKRKSFTGQVHLVPAEGFHLYANWIGGDENSCNSAFGEIDGSYTNLFDLTTFYQATEQLKIGLNAAYGNFSTGALVVDETNPYSHDAVWKGAALYLNYAVTEKAGLGIRAERFEDPSGVRYFGAFKGNEFTFTGDVKLADGHFNMKPELRIDTSKDAYFQDAQGNLKNSQVTVGAAFVYSFGSK